MQLFRFLLRYSSWLLVLSTFLGIVSGAGSAYVLSRISDELNASQGIGLGGLPLFAALVGLVVGTELLSRLLLLRVSSNIVRRMRITLCEQILRAPLRRVEASGSSGLMAALTEDVQRITEAMLALPAQCANMGIAIACFVYLYMLAWPLALAYTLIFLYGIVAHELITRLARPSMDGARKKWDELFGVYDGLVGGNKELKLHRPRRQALVAQDLTTVTQDMRQLAWRWNAIVAVAAAHTQLIFYALLGFVLYASALVGSYGTVVLQGFVLMALFMSSPIASIVGAWPKFHAADVSLQSIRKLGLSLAGEAKTDLREQAGVLAQERFRSLEFDAVRFDYQAEDGGDKPFQLGPVSFKLEPGELVFVIGGNGSGKSSFVRLLTGLYPPSAGEVRFNGQAIDEDNRDDYRQHFSVAFSDYHLFRNLHGLNTDQLAQRVAKHLDRLDLTDKVSVHETRLSTLDLSQGQRKRLALLTLLLEQRSVMVFDEWAADQDPHFKRVFYYEVLPELKAQGRTIVVVSHDDQYFDCADRIVRFTEGRIISDERMQRRPHTEPALLG
jgi:putative ATP-binding cassette transporter